ncbi:hypothetical protein PRIPAC_70938 [Pristionchus pacificus]|uniref:Uncharacterized protein n=1 Tax=Pristionchus pacificus TaxID=54126 RepID=A0A2A6C5G4_PRIPA|nr:hypothetical protein PRIPAC_70938 [Pristionchus pacificus]|eukprot:PDM73261.1 hypothetical protein PRIPAC_40617 [Pristionchus pacificus]
MLHLFLVLLLLSIILDARPFEPFAAAQKCADCDVNFGAIMIYLCANAIPMSSTSMKFLVMGGGGMKSDPALKPNFHGARSNAELINGILRAKANGELETAEKLSKIG